MLKTVRLAKAVLFAACLALAMCMTVTALATVVETQTSDAVIETDHVWAYKILVKDANCSDPPTYQETCTICGAKREYKEGVTNGQHVWGEWVVDSVATCTSAGSRHRVCQLNVHHTEQQTVAATGHTLQWRTAVAATCTSTGISEHYCTVCGVVVETTTIPMTDHAWGAWTIIKQPTCTEAGQQTHTCTNCGLTETGVYGSALGHSWGPWQNTVAATCTNPGQRTRVCQRDASHVENEPISALGHNWGPWQITIAATCDSNGTRTRVCQRDASHVETEVIPSPGHQWTAWRRVVEPTFWEKGREERNCTVCGLVQTRDLDTITYPNATLCAFGPRLKESNLYPNYSDRWYMFTPFDASMNGSQTFELVAADSVIVGDVTLNIRDGYLTIDYTLKGGDAINVTLEFFTVLNSINQISTYEPESLMAMRINRNQAINLNEQFPGDTHLVLYFCSRCSVRNHPAFTSLSYNSSTHRALLDRMRALMD